MSPGIADPDIAQAIEDFAELVEEIRQRDGALARLRAGSPAYQAEARSLADLRERIAVRADRLGIGVDALTELIIQRNSLKARRGRSEPVRTTARTALDRLSKARSAKTAAMRTYQAAYRAVSEANREVKAATEPIS